MARAAAGRPGWTLFHRSEPNRVVAVAAVRAQHGPLVVSPYAIAKLDRRHFSVVRSLGGAPFDLLP